MEKNKKNSMPSISFNPEPIRRFFSKDNAPMLSLIWLAIFTLATIIVSTVVFHINVIVACVMVVLAAALAACLNRIQLWVHGLVFIALIVCGIMASKVPFMILVALVYVFAITFLFIWSNNN